MAGGDHHGPLIEDPALMRYNDAFTNRYKYFRWTPRTARITFTAVVLIPALVGYLGYSTDGKYNMRGKKRGDTVSEF